MLARTCESALHCWPKSLSLSVLRRGGRRGRCPLQKSRSARRQKREGVRERQCARHVCGVGVEWVGGGAVRGVMWAWRGRGVSVARGCCVECTGGVSSGCSLLEWMRLSHSHSAS